MTFPLGDASVTQSKIFIARFTAIWGNLPLLPGVTHQMHSMQQGNVTAAQGLVNSRPAS
jgi:hypothetical protein